MTDATADSPADVRADGTIDSSTDSLHRSPLHEVHVAAGASFTDFGGWLMPVRYGSDLAEHHAVRTAAGIFDISHMAELPVSGSGAGAFLDYAVAGSLSTLAVGKAKYTMILEPDGGIIDDLIVYRLGEADYMVVANAGNREPVVAALTERLAGSNGVGFDAQLRDDTEAVSLIAVQGPQAQGILEQTEWLDLDAARSHGWDLASLPYYAALGMTFHGTPILVARTGYTGEDGFELFAPADLAADLWAGLVNSGAQHGMLPCGLAARDSLRLEAGMPLYGHELSRDILPVQAGLGRIVPKSKTADFVGRAALEAGPAPGASVLVGLVADGKRAARAGYEIVEDDRVIGTVTSGLLSPTLGRPIAMAFIAPDRATPGEIVNVAVRGDLLPATVVTLPFYEREQHA